MTLFETHVTPKISQAVYALELIQRQSFYALERGDYRRVQRLSAKALYYQDRLVLLRACEGQPDSVISWHLATI